MTITHNDLVNTIKSKYAKKLIKIEVLNSDYEIIDTLTPLVISGNIEYSYDNGTRRTANIIFDNSDNTFIPGTDKLWINNMFKIYTGYYINGENYYIPRGIFEYGENECSSNFSESCATFSLYDQISRLDGTLSGTLEAPYIIDSGQSIETVLKTLFTDAGFSREPIIYPTSETTPFSIATTMGQTYFDIIKSLGDMLSWVYYFDSNGYFRFEPPTNIDTAGSVWDFTTSEINYLGGQRRYAFSEIKNNVVVVGDNIDSILIKATASDTNPSSDTNITLIGKRTLIVEDANIYNVSLAAQRADFELQKAISMIETINMSCIPVDLIKTDDVISITDSAIDLSSDRYLVKSVSFPLTSEEAMTLSLWRARSLS